MSDFQHWLLIELDLPALIKAQRDRTPAIPPNWKPGVFSSDKPWGTLEDATALIAGGKIPEGRELLRRLCKHTYEPAPKAVFAKELTRPPEDGKLSWSYLSQLPAVSSEFNSIKAARLLGQRNYNDGGESWLKAQETPPSSSYGAAFLFDAFLFSSDLFFQTQLLMPLKREMEYLLVGSPMKGIAQLTMRQQEEAWNTFKTRWLQPEVSAENYEKNLKLKMTADELKLHTNTICLMCIVGMGRVLFDLGLRKEAARVFAELNGKLDGNLQYAAQILSQA